MVRERDDRKAWRSKWGDLRFVRFQRPDRSGEWRASPRPKARARRNLRRPGAKQEESGMRKAAGVRVSMVAVKPGNAGGAKGHRKMDR